MTRRMVVLPLKDGYTAVVLNMTTRPALLLVWVEVTSNSLLLSNVKTESNLMYQAYSFRCQDKDRRIGIVTRQLAWKAEWD